MKTSIQSPVISLLSLFIISLVIHPAHARNTEQWEEEGTTLVGRISYIEGQLIRYHAHTDDWELTSRDAPFGSNDLLQAEADSKAEFIMPNNTWIRIGGNTRIDLVTLDPQSTETDIAFGTARLYNKSADTGMAATTPFGRISAPPGAVFDIRVQEEGVDIIAIKKKVYFTHNASADRHVIRADSTALYADMQEVTATSKTVEYSWRKWNRQMDAQWAARLRSKGSSTANLPAELHSEAYPLDQHGVWERVYYNGAYYRFWRPVHVHVSWAPFTRGVWSVWQDDHVWIPHEPFGYVTHHYGNWVFTAGFWYWAPPVTRVMIRTHRHFLKIGFGWYPGRVAWIHHGAHLGWIPLAPREPYYTHRRWGRRSIVVTKRARYRHRPRKYRYHDHAVVIHRSHLYRSKGYRKARIRNIPRTTIRNNFRSSPVLDASVIKDHRSLRKKARVKPMQQRRRVYPSNKIGRTHVRKRLAPKSTERQRTRESNSPRLRRQGKTTPIPGRHQRMKQKPKAAPNIHRTKKTVKRPRNYIQTPPKRLNPPEAVKTRSFSKRAAPRTDKPSHRYEKGGHSAQYQKRRPVYRPQGRSHSNRTGAATKRYRAPGGRHHRVGNNRR